MCDDRLRHRRDPTRPSCGPLFLLVLAATAAAAACHDDSVGSLDTDAVALDTDATDSVLDVPTPNDSGADADTDVAGDASVDGATDATEDGDAAADPALDGDAPTDLSDDGPTADGDLTDPDATQDSDLFDLTPLECLADIDPCSAGTNCFCGGPGPVGTCFCGQECETADDCQDPSRPVCCGDTCTSACECFCD